MKGKGSGGFPSPPGLKRDRLLPHQSRITPGCRGSRLGNPPPTASKFSSEFGAIWKQDFGLSSASNESSSLQTTNTGETVGGGQSRRVGVDTGLGGPGQGSEAQARGQDSTVVGAI